MAIAPPRLGGLVRDSPSTRALRWVAYLIGLLILAFALNYYQLFLGLQAVLLLVILIVADVLALKTRTGSAPGATNENSIRPSQRYSIALGVAVSLIVFAAYWYVAPDLFGLPSSITSALSVAGLGLGTVFSLDLMFSMSQGIAEERLWRFALINRIASYAKGPVGIYLAIVVGGLFFFLYHVPRYYADPQALGLTLVSGILLGYLAFAYRALIVSTLGHLIWNFFVTGGSALLHAVISGQLVDPAAMVNGAAPLLLFSGLVLARRGFARVRN